MAGYNSYVTQAWTEAILPLVQTHPTLLDPAVYTQDAFRVAFATMRARSFSPLEGDDVAIVPGTDLLPHSRNPTCTLRVTKAGSGGALLSGFSNPFGGAGRRSNRKDQAGGDDVDVDPKLNRVVQVVAARDLAAGATLTLNYGPDKSDGQICLDHGVVDVTAKRVGMFNLTLGITEDDKNGFDKIDILETANLSATMEFEIADRVTPSTELLAFLRLLNLDGGDSFLLEPVFRNVMWSEHLQMPISEDNEGLVCASMLNGAREALARLDSTPAEDVAAVSRYLAVAEKEREKEKEGGGSGSGSRSKLAAAWVRLGEREVLEWVVQWFESRSASLSGLEYYQERRLKGLGLLDEEGGSTYDPWSDVGNLEDRN